MMNKRGRHTSPEEIVFSIAVDPNHHNKQCRCFGCNHILFHELNEYVTLGCAGKHTLCMGCFAKQVAVAGCNNTIACPTCKKRCDTFALHELKFDKLRKRMTTKTSSSHHIISKPDPRMDPVRHYQQEMTPATCENFCSITMVTSNKIDSLQPGGNRRNSNNNNVNVQINTGIISTTNPSEMGEANASMMENIFQSFHSIFVTNDTSNDIQYDPFAYPTNNSILDAVKNDQSILHRLIFALSYGDKLKSIIVTKQDQAYWDRLIKKTFCITDLVRFLRTTREGFVPTLISRHTVAQRVPDNVMNVLQDFGLSRLKSSVRKQQNKITTETIRAGIDFNTINRHELHVNVSDNMGHRIRDGINNRVGYCQTTQRAIVKISLKQLIAAHLYWDPNGPEEQDILIRVGKNWNDIKMEHESLVVPDTNDENYLAQQQFGIIDLILQIDQDPDNRLPTYEDCEMMLEHRSFYWKQPEMKYWNEFGNTYQLEGENNSTEFEATIEMEMTEEAAEGQTATHLNANNAIMDIQIERDLNDSDTVKALLEDGMNRGKLILEKGCKDSPAFEKAQEQHGIKPLYESFPNIQVGDGKPMIEAQNLRRKHLELRDTILGIGGFHVGLIGWKAIGRLFQFAFLGAFFSLWRTTEGQLKYVMVPGNPNQVIRETTVVVYAIYLEAIRGYVRSLGTNTETIDVSAIDVFDFMCERAKHDRLILVVLLYLRCVHVIQMLYESEKRASLRLYISCMKYILLMSCISHCIGYVSLLSDFFRDYECASPALKVMYEKFILFRKTVFGKNIFTDRFMEWIIKGLREQTGKHISGSVDTHLKNLMHVVLQLNESMAIKRMKTRTSGPKKHMRTVDKIFCEITLYLRDTNMFGPGERIIVDSKPYNNRKSNLYTEAISSIEDATVVSPTGIPLNVECLFQYSTALEVIEDYWKFYYINNKNMEETKRSEKDVSLATINAEISTRDATLQKELDRCVTLERRYLLQPGVYTGKELDIEIDRLKESLRTHQQQQPTSTITTESFMKKIRKSKNGKNTKEIKVKSVILARKKLLELNQNWGQQRLEEMKTVRVQERLQELLDLDEKVNNEIRLISFQTTTTRQTVSNRKRSILVSRCVTNSRTEDTDQLSSQPSTNSQYTDTNSAGFGVSFMQQMGSPQCSTYSLPSKID